MWRASTRYEALLKGARLLAGPGLQLLQLRNHLLALALQLAQAAVLDDDAWQRMLVQHQLQHLHSGRHAPQGC